MGAAINRPATHGNGVRAHGSPPLAQRGLLIQKNHTTSPKRHLVFINRSYWPDVEATGQLLTELAEDLAEDFRVTVVCGQPSQVADRSSYVRRGEEFRNGVRILRLAHTRFAKASFWGRLTNMVTFLAAATWKCATLGRADAVVVETDPPLLCLLGRWLQITRRCKLVCYLQDIYPDVAVALGKLSDNLLTRFIDRIFYAVYRRSDGVIVLSRDMQRHMESRGIAASRIHCIPNWIDTRRIVPRQTDNAFRAAHQLADKFVVMYSGNLGFSQRLEHVIEAADRLRGDSRFEFVLIGNGANRAPLEDLVRQLGLANTRFFDYQPKSQLAESLSAADVHIVFLDPRITHCLMPSKIYGVLATGSVALVLGESTSELAQMVITNQVGRVVAADDAEAIVGAIRDLASEPDFCRAAGIRARDLAVKRFDRQVARQQFRSMMRDVLGESQLQFGASSA